MAEVLSFATANLWNQNPEPEADITRLLTCGLDAVGLNEAWPYSDLIADLSYRYGYTAHGHDTANPAEVILLSDRFTDVEVEQRQTAYWTGRYISEGGAQINRHGIAARWTDCGKRYALLNIHLNTSAQDSRDWAKPNPVLPADELQSYADSVKRSSGWARRLRAEGCRTVVVGDTNWAYSTPMRDAWKWSTQKAFRRRAGMRSQYQYEMLPRLKGDKRPVEYVLWSAEDFKYVGQRFITPEHSDHPFHRVDLTPKG